MSSIPLEKIQPLLKLSVEYPYFPTWEETLEFEVDGVPVKAIAIHAWRSESIKIVEPFEVSGWEYQQVFCPPLFALAFSMHGWKAALARDGLTLHDACIQMAYNTYKMHFIYKQSL